MRFKVANYSRLEIRLDTLHIYTLFSSDNSHSILHQTQAYNMYFQNLHDVTVTLISLDLVEMPQQAFINIYST